VADRRGLPARTLGWLESLARRRLGAVVLFALALGVYAIEAVAWPLSAGRDLDDYLRYYVQILDGNTLLPAAMLFRTPVAPIVDGLSLDVGGGHLAEPAMAVLYGASVVAWSAAARTFGAWAAIVTGLVLLVYPGYGAMFHELASEPVFAAAFAGWALLVTRAATRPSMVRFALVGLGIALLALIRPGNQILVLFCAFPLLLAAAWRKRLAWAGAALGALVASLALYAVYNGVRYGDYTVARGGPTAVPFYRAFVTDRIVRPGNGSGSRKLAAAVRQHLITRQPYRGYGITVDDVFTSGSYRIVEDLNLLSDEVFGWGSNYGTIGDAGLEAVRAHPGTYASGVAHSIWSELWSPFYRVVSSGRPAGSTEAETVVIQGRRLPRPSEGQPIPPGQSYWISRPDNSIREVWTSPTRHVFAFADPGQRPRFERIEADLDRLLGALPDRSGDATVSLWLNRASRWFPRPALWLLLGLVALVLRRPRNWRILVGLAAAALLVPLFTALGLPTDLHYVLPVAPAFVLFGLGALLGTRPEAPADGLGAGVPGPPAEEDDHPWEGGEHERGLAEERDEGGLGGADAERVEEGDVRDLAHPEAADRDR
jgi:hypothetical protein